MKPRRVVVSGSSGGGKSTLIEEMQRRGYTTVPEPGRRIIAGERRGDGRGLPWVDTQAFCTRVIRMARSDFQHSSGNLVLFDRSALDALIWFDRTGTPIDKSLRQMALSIAYDRCIYLVPPWPEIYKRDADRQHGFSEALAEFQSLCERLPQYGFETVLIPKLPVAARADWLETELN